VDFISYGTNSINGLTNGNAHGLYDESISRYPDGSPNWVKTYATPGKTNLNRWQDVPRVALTNFQNNIYRIDVYGKTNIPHVLQSSDNPVAVKWNNLMTNCTPFKYTNSSISPLFFRAVEDIELDIYN
jgi:hypothetical protein